MMRWLHAMQARARLLFARRAAESRMDEEFRFHIEMETERLVREAGLEPQEAKRRALGAFGGVERHKEELRDGRGLGWISGLSLDLKLGLRMLVKYPGLALVGVVGMAVAVAICAASFGVISVLVDSTLPLPDGDRIVVIENLDTRTSNEARGSYLHDLVAWRETLTAVDDIGAWRTINRNLITPDGHPESVSIAEMSASGFGMSRVPPLVGRYFNAADERIGAPSVVVIGYTVWQNRFASRPDVVGQTLQLGDTRYAIIGVMPRGFAFPVNNTIWTPLRLDPASFERGHAPKVDVFGRLAPGATLQDAQTQLSAIGKRLAAAYPESHRYIQPRVLPYTRSFLDSPQVAWALQLARFLVSMLVVVIGTNVAILVYARTATRTSEIAVRSALGASRGRIVAQLFAEALVLSVIAAAVGIAGAHVLLQQIRAFMSRMGGATEQLPFWWHFGISPSLALYVAGLAILAAVIVGVLPALKATRRQVQPSLQQLGAGGSGMRLGRTWTVLIVAQVAVAVAVLPLALRGAWLQLRIALAEPTFATEQFLTATVILDEPELHETPEAARSAARNRASLDATKADSVEHDRAFATRFANLRAELIRRLETEPGVAGVVLASAVPGNEPEVRMEVDSVAAAAAGDAARALLPASTLVGVNHVGLDFFDAFDVPMLAGRRFQAGDFSSASAAVIVNQSFVRELLGGGNPLGRRVRHAAKNGDLTTERAQNAPWEEIVGVVPDFPNPSDPTTIAPRMYRPLLPTDARPVTLAIHVRGASPASVAGRLRDLMLAVDPMLRLRHGVATLDGAFTLDMAVDRVALLAVLLLTLSTLLLSAAGIYALTAFTITRRRREIGIRSALGGQARRVLANVLARALGQVAIGIIIGVALAGLIDRATSGAMMRGQSALFLPMVAALMAAVSLIAAIGPARRALRIQPTEALKAE